MYKYLGVLSVQEGKELSVLNQKTGVLQHQQEAARDLLPVYRSKHPYVCSGVLGGGDLEKKYTANLYKLARKAHLVVVTDLKSMTSMAE